MSTPKLFKRSSRAKPENPPSDYYPASVGERLAWERCHECDGTTQGANHGTCFICDGEGWVPPAELVEQAAEALLIRMDLEEHTAKQYEMAKELVLSVLLAQARWIGERS